MRMEDFVRGSNPELRRASRREKFPRIGAGPRKTHGRLLPDRENVDLRGVRKGHADPLQRTKFQRSKFTEGLKKAILVDKKQEVVPQKTVTASECQGRAGYDSPKIDLQLSIDTAFCREFIAQFKTLNVQSGEVPLLRKINANIISVDKVINGMSSTNARPQSVHTPQAMACDDPAPLDHSLLLPRSQWVYETPDKQRMKKMGEMRFTDNRPAMEPAVIELEENSRTVYGLDECMRGRVDLTALQNGQEVPIDLKYLKPVCVISTVQAATMLEDNQFLTQPCEDTITIEQDRQTNHVEPMRVRSLKRRHEEDDLGLNWYEKHMKMLATCKPSKVLEKVDRKTLLHRKSLSFQDTPTSHLRITSRFRSLDEGSSCREQLDENDFSLLESEFYGGDSGGFQDRQADANLETLPLLLGNMATGGFNEIPVPKFYPRKNYD